MKVKDKYRSNMLSLEPGGVTVTVEYYSGKVLDYDKVKNPKAYISTFMKRPDVKNAYIKTVIDQ